MAPTGSAPHRLPRGAADGAWKALLFLARFNRLAEPASPVLQPAPGIRTGVHRRLAQMALRSRVRLAVKGVGRKSGVAWIFRPSRAVSVPRRQAWVCPMCCSPSSASYSSSTWCSTRKYRLRLRDLTQGRNTIMSTAAKAGRLPRDPQWRHYRNLRCNRGNARHTHCRGALSRRRQGVICDLRAQCFGVCSMRADCVGRHHPQTRSSDHVSKGQAKRHDDAASKHLSSWSIMLIVLGLVGGAVRRRRPVCLFGFFLCSLVEGTAARRRDSS